MIIALQCGSGIRFPLMHLVKIENYLKILLLWKMDEKKPHSRVSSSSSL